MFGDETLCRILHSVAGVAKLVDAPGLGPDAVKACRFESDLPHQTQESEFSEMRFGFFILNAKTARFERAVLTKSRFAYRIAKLIVKAVAIKTVITVNSRALPVKSFNNT